jgi:subtilisin
MQARAITALVVTAFVALSAPAASAVTDEGATAGDTRVIVLIGENADPRAVLEEHADEHAVEASVVYDDALAGYAATVPADSLADLRADPAVTAVVPDRSWRLDDMQPLVQPEATQEPTESLKRIGGLDSPTADIDGIDDRVDVDVAVIDSGIESDHPDLAVAGGVDCATGANDPGGWEDVHGHGTMVAGIVAALDNDIGRVGVAPGARVWSVRVATAQGVITESSLLCGLDWVVAHADTIDVANLSLGGAPTDPSPPPTEANTDCAASTTSLEARIVCMTVESGVTVVAAAGNGSADARTVTPARVETAITVSSMTDTDGEPGGEGPTPECLAAERDDTFAYFSNYGPGIDLSAPGVCIESTYRDSQYATNSGTSFSTAMVSGGAGLYLAGHPDATPADVLEALQAAAEPGPLPEDPDAFPEGLLDVSDF